MPTKAGIQNYLKTLDSRLRGNDAKGRFKTFYGTIKVVIFLNPLGLCFAQIGEYLMDTFIRSKFNAYRNQGRVKLGSPVIPGKNTLIFCTYSGPHTGIREAIPAGLYAGHFFNILVSLLLMSGKCSTFF